MLARQKWQIDTIRVLEEVFSERERQVNQYGHNEKLEDGTGPDVRWLLPISSNKADRVEELFREEYEEYEEKHDGLPTWMHLVREEAAEAFKESDPERLEAELLQVAALCVSWIEKLRWRKNDHRELAPASFSEGHYPD